MLAPIIPSIIFLSVRTCWSRNACILRSQEKSSWNTQYVNLWLIFPMSSTSEELSAQPTQRAPFMLKSLVWRAVFVIRTSRNMKGTNWWKIVCKMLARGARRSSGIGSMLNDKKFGITSRRTSVYGMGPTSTKNCRKLLISLFKVRLFIRAKFESQFDVTF